LDFRYNYLSNISLEIIALSLAKGMIDPKVPETTTGGNALKFYCSVRIDVRRIATLKQGESSIGNRVKAKVVKNKVAPPFRQAEFDIMFGEGISFVGELIDYGVKMDIIDKSGAWFSYGSEKLGQGKENSKITIKENPEMMTEIEQKIKEALGYGAGLTVDESEMQED
jgi:recombination protein RecA